MTTSATFESFNAGVTLPGTPEWEQHWEYGRDRWRELWGLSNEQFDGMYDRYRSRSPAAWVKSHDGQIVGQSQPLLPLPGVTDFRQAGLLVIRDVLEGNPLWGPLHMHKSTDQHGDTSGWKALDDEYDPRTAVDVMCHFSDSNDSAVAVAIESLVVGLAFELGEIHADTDMPPNKRENGPVIVTDLVEYYRRILHGRYNHTAPDGTATVGVLDLGEARPYDLRGDATPRIEWATVAVLRAKQMVKADRLNRNRPGLLPSLFKTACPGFKDWYEDAHNTWGSQHEQ